MEVIAKLIPGFCFFVTLCMPISIFLFLFSSYESVRDRRARRAMRSIERLHTKILLTIHAYSLHTLHNIMNEEDLVGT